ELAGHPAGIGRGTAGGRLAHQDLAVVAEEHHRRHRRGAVAERERLDHALAFGSRGRVRRAEVDAEEVSHPCSSGAVLLPQPCRGPAGVIRRPGGRTRDETSRPRAIVAPTLAPPPRARTRMYTPVSRRPGHSSASTRARLRTAS